MLRIARLGLGLLALVLLAACVDVAGQPLDWRTVAHCPITQPNGAIPPGERASAAYHGDGDLWTALWPGGVVQIPAHAVEPDGRLSMKWPWWRGVSGPLTLRGRRLDDPAPPLAAHIPAGYGARGFQATALIFATPGCWEVTGQVGEATLTFVTLVVPETPQE